MHITGHGIDVKAAALAVTEHLNGAIIGRYHHPSAMIFIGEHIIDRLFLLR